MTLTRSALFLAPIATCVGLALGQSTPPSTTTHYLQGASDRYQSTIDVYTDADAAGNHFAARGEIHGPNPNGPVTPTMDEISSSAQCLGITCITATFNGSGSNWGGWYFQNGILGATDRAPLLNWGTQANAGYDLTGATSLRFWAKGAVGGERVEFFAFGVGRDPETGAPTANYPDSNRKASSGLIALNTTWTQYTISLTGLDIQYVLGGFGWVAAAGNQANPLQSITFYLDNIQYQKARPTDPRFIVSYETIKSKSTIPFDMVDRNTAFVYDNAIALIALVAAGDLTRARTIADSLLYAQAHDRFFNDGRLRNGYQGGDIMLPPGWLPNDKANTVRMAGWYDVGRSEWLEDETQVSSNTGNIAWAMLALLSFYDATKEQKYLAAVDQLGNWVIDNTSDTRGDGGFTGGYDGWENGAAAGATSSCASNDFVNGQCKRLYKSSEHNIDLYAAFSRLYKLEGLSQWQQAAQQAKAFFLSMWDPIDGKFYAGTDELGVNPTTAVIPLDIQAWSLEALGADAGPYLRSLNYIETHHKTALGYGFKQDGGNSCGDHTWFEGTAQVAVAYRLIGNTAKWNSILNSLHSAQLQSGAMLATDWDPNGDPNKDCLNTGFNLNDNKPWVYYPRAHVGATAWLSLAEQGVNPFGANAYSPTLKAGMHSPAPGSALASGATTFTWTAGSSTTTGYYLWVGTQQGGRDLANIGRISTTSTPVTLPGNGARVYVRLWTQFNGSLLLYNDYTYTESAPLAIMLSPAPGSTLASGPTTFSWTAGPGATTGYYLWVGTQQGGHDLANIGRISTTSTPVTLPANGARVYVRLWTQFNGSTLLYNDYTYTESAPLAIMLSPAPGSTLASGPTTFSWTAGPGATTGYYLWVGTQQGGHDLANIGRISTTSTPVTLPGNGARVYVRLWTQFNGSTLLYNDYTYTESAPHAIMLSPAPGSTLTGGATTFTWTAGPSATTGYYLWVGTQQGGHDLANIGRISSTSTLVSLPGNGARVYVRLWTQLNGSTLLYNDYTYTESAPLAIMRSPAPGSTLASGPTTFSWTAGPGATTGY